jgi:hypothetical protein
MVGEMFRECSVNKITVKNIDGTFPEHFLRRASPFTGLIAGCFFASIGA